ncbi:MAG: vitamin B12-dependent ribonucleotide reductase [Deltaproteobacteria bacterium]|nr:vitamin B12-dependent ribonucleotide reductase [Deltaproteobacteria bacterium]
MAEKLRRKATMDTTRPARSTRSEEQPPTERRGLTMKRYFTRPGVHPYTEVEWEKRSAVISGEKGETVFEQHDVEIPKPWSQLATNVVVSKYFRGQLGTPQREQSVKQLIGRVVDTITNWGRKDGYFTTEDDASVFADELTHLLIHQKLAFNSPVWFNVGVEPHPQCSACFILSVDDKMDSILDWYRKEGVIFKGGSGSGVNLSKIRSSKERLAGGGTASGPVSFMRAADASAGVIKSGGKTRRAAKMVVLNADHPDIGEFIQCKAEEEKKAWTLIDAGYDGSIDGAAYNSVFFQNANNSVRVTDEFMRAVVEDRSWSTRYITTGEICETVRARDLLQKICEATWQCGDPGMQYDTTINTWHTCPNTDRINASNPCSEYMHLDNSACNLASLNLMKFLRDDNGFDTVAFKQAVDISITAQDILVDNSTYPTEEITANARAFRQLGLGYANLGALLMSLGLPYDSEAGRQYAGAITALMTGEGYLQSAHIAEQMGPFSGYAVNREPMLDVIDKHRSYAHKLDPSLVPLDLLSDARKSWEEALALGRKAGYRNSQATVLAPTGTIAFMMDCDTTGVEPDIALVKYKRLVGGGLLKIVNHTVPRALRRLGYDNTEIQDIIEYIDEHETIEGAPLLRDEHLPVFDCAFKPNRGVRTIHYLGHVRMMGAVQPFLSGAISKTINMPTDATVLDISEAYMESWRLGLKAVAIYRDGCKRIQPLGTGDKKSLTQPVPVVIADPEPTRRRLPMDRQAICHKFDIAGHEGYIHVGFYEDGTPGEIFIKMAKEGSTISGLMDTIATLTSLALQYGVPLEALVSKFGHVRFEPSGFTQNPEIPYAKSLTDYIFRFLGTRFLTTDQRPEVSQGGQPDHRESSRGTVEHAHTLEAPERARAPLNGSTKGATASVAAFANGPYPSHGDSLRSASSSAQAGASLSMTWQSQSDAPSCADCGSIMIRNGACYKCLNCGATSGCS